MTEMRHKMAEHAHGQQCPPQTTVEQWQREQQWRASFILSPD